MFTGRMRGFVGVEAPKVVIVICGFGVEDVKHFLLQCPLYEDARQILKEDIMTAWEEGENRGNLYLSCLLYTSPSPRD